jgi:hypothetical protein
MAALKLPRSTVVGVLLAHWHCRCCRRIDRREQCHAMPAIIRSPAIMLHQGRLLGDHRRLLMLHRAGRGHALGETARKLLSLGRWTGFRAGAPGSRRSAWSPEKGDRFWDTVRLTNRKTSSTCSSVARPRCWQLPFTLVAWVAWSPN